MARAADILFFYRSIRAQFRFRVRAPCLGALRRAGNAATVGARRDMDVHATSMQQRMPAQSVIEKLLHEHTRRPASSSLRLALGISPIHRDDLSWHTGAVGERIVAGMLARLPQDWHVFHSLPVGTGESDIDHVVVGPGGIFTLNTKHHPGKKIWVRGHAFWVSGQHTDYLRNSEHEADRLTKIIHARFPQAPAVSPVIVVVNASDITVKTRPARVRIETPRGITAWLAKRPTILHPEAVRMIAAMLDDPQTWRAVIPSDCDELQQRFDELSRSHDRANAIRLAWLLVGLLAVVGVGLLLLHAL